MSWYPLSQADLDQAHKMFAFCVSVIDKPPEEYRIVKQAVLGIIHLSARCPELRPKSIPYILKVIQDPVTYRSNPRRYAVQSIGSITYYDPSMIEPSIELLLQMIQRGTETSQFVRKAAFIALSRIGRRYPYYQKQLIPIFMYHYQHPMTRDSVKWGIVIGIGKMSQSNEQLRSSFWRELLVLCRSPIFRIRWAAIKALGHMCCALGNVRPDEIIEQLTFDIGCDFLKHGGVPDIIAAWKSEDPKNPKAAALKQAPEVKQDDTNAEPTQPTDSGTTLTTSDTSASHEPNQGDSPKSSTEPSKEETTEEKPNPDAAAPSPAAPSSPALQPSTDDLPAATSTNQDAPPTEEDSTSTEAKPSDTAPVKVTPGVLTDEQWKKEDVYLVQYAATQALALLLRSNPSKWWGRISVEFGKLLINPKVAAMSKAMVMITYGKIAGFMARESHFYKAIKDLLFELCSNDNILVSEPATYGLVNFALAHQELYPEVRALVLAKLSGSVENALPTQLQYYLKTWCKLVVRDFSPMNPRSPVISDQQQLDRTEVVKFKQSQFGDSYGEDDPSKQWASREKSHSNLPESKLAAKDRIRLEALCESFSPAVIESVVLLFKDTATLDDRSFLDNLRTLINRYVKRLAATKSSQPSSSTDTQVQDVAASGSAAGASDSSTPGTAPSDSTQASDSEPKRPQLSEEMLIQVDSLWELDDSLKESAISMLLQPNLLEDTIWLSNLKMYVANSSSIRAKSESNSMAAQDILNPAFDTRISQNLPTFVDTRGPGGQQTSQQHQYRQHHQHHHQHHHSQGHYEQQSRGSQYPSAHGRGYTASPPPPQGQPSYHQQQSQHQPQQQHSYYPPAAAYPQPSYNSQQPSHYPQQQHQQQQQQYYRAPQNSQQQQQYYNAPAASAPLHGHAQYSDRQSSSSASYGSGSYYSQYQGQNPQGAASSQPSVQYGRSSDPHAYASTQSGSAQYYSQQQQPPYSQSYHSGQQYPQGREQDYRREDRNWDRRDERDWGSRDQTYRRGDYDSRDQSNRRDDRGGDRRDARDERDVPRDWAARDLPPTRRDDSRDQSYRRTDWDEAYPPAKRSKYQ